MRRLLRRASADRSGADRAGLRGRGPVLGRMDRMVRDRRLDDHGGGRRIRPRRLAAAEARGAKLMHRAVRPSQPSIPPPPLRLSPRSSMPSPSALIIYVVAAVAEIAGCFAVWAWLRLGHSPLWLIPGALSLAAFAYLLTRIDTGFAGRAYAAYAG